VRGLAFRNKGKVAIFFTSVDAAFEEWLTGVAGPSFTLEQSVRYPASGNKPCVDGVVADEMIDGESGISVPNFGV